MTRSALIARLREDAQRLRSSGAPIHRDVADRIDEMLGDVERLGNVEEKARAYAIGQRGGIRSDGKPILYVHVRPDEFLALLVALGVQPGFDAEGYPVP